MYEKSAKGVVVLVVLALAILLSSAVVAIPDPSAMYCKELGGEFEKLKGLYMR
jgi:hypothetical protein